MPYQFASEVTLAHYVSPRGLRWRLRRSRLLDVLRGVRRLLASLWPRNDFAGLDERMLRDIGMERTAIGHADHLDGAAESLRRAPADAIGARHATI
jgi:hypothetical protein